MAEWQMLASFLHCRIPLLHCWNLSTSERRKLRSLLTLTESFIFWRSWVVAAFARCLLFSVQPKDSASCFPQRMQLQAVFISPFPVFTNKTAMQTTGQWFPAFSSHGAHKLITNILHHTKKYIFCQSDKKKRYNFDLFTSDSYCVGCCHFFFWRSVSDNMKFRISVFLCVNCVFFKDFISLFRERGRKGEREGEKH